MTKDVVIYLEHVLESIELIEQYIKGLDLLLWGGSGSGMDRHPKAFA